MPLVQIRDVPEDAHRELKSRAAARGESLNSYLLELIEREVAVPTLAQVLERAASLSTHTSGSAVDLLADARAERDGELGRRTAR